MARTNFGFSAHFRLVDNDVRGTERTVIFVFDYRVHGLEQRR